MFRATKNLGICLSMTCRLPYFQENIIETIHTSSTDLTEISNWLFLMKKARQTYSAIMTFDGVTTT